MDTRPVPPVSATVASMLSILASVGVLIVGLLFDLVAHAKPSANDSALTPHGRMILKLVSYSLLGLGFLGIINGVGLLGLKNWARRTMVIGSGTTVILSVYCLYASIALLGIPPPSEMKLATAHAVWGAFFGMSLFVFGVGLWLVTVFTRPATLASFVVPPASASATASSPSCPLALALLAGFYVMGGIISVLFLGAPNRTPDMVFAHALYGAPRIQYVLIMSGLGLAAAIGLFRVKSWGIHLAIGLELFSISSHAVTLLHPRAVESLRSALAAMAEHGAKPHLPDPALGFHYLEGLGLGFALLLLLILLLARSQFLRATSAPAALP